MRKFLLASLLASTAILTNCTLANNGLSGVNSRAVTPSKRVIIKKKIVKKHKTIIKKSKKDIKKLKVSKIRKIKKSHKKLAINKTLKRQKSIKSLSKNVTPRILSKRKALKIKKWDANIFVKNSEIINKIEEILNPKKSLKRKSLKVSKNHKKLKTIKRLKRKLLANKFKSIRKKIKLDGYSAKYDFQYISLKFNHIKYAKKPEPYSLSSRKRDPELLGPQSTLKNNPLAKS